VWVSLKDKKDIAPLINDRIRAAQLQVIDQDGVNIGVISRIKALELADDVGLDLVMLSEEGADGVPIVKIMDFGKASYEKKKKKAEARKHQKVVKIKEIKIRPKIGGHDFSHKLDQLIDFLKEGMRVKITLCFRGRENITKEAVGSDLFKKIESELNEHGLAKLVLQEGDTKIGQSWSRVYFMKSTK
jgi:translation initiation factor IF-3